MEKQGEKQVEERVVEVEEERVAGFLEALEEVEFHRHCLRRSQNRGMAIVDRQKELGKQMVD